MEVLRNSVITSLNNMGIKNVKNIIYNPSFDELYKAELNPSLQGFEKGYVTELGAVNVMTGKFTGRSPKDRFIVKDDITKDRVWWGSINIPFESDAFQKLYDKVTNYLSEKEVFDLAFSRLAPAYIDRCSGYTLLRF